MKEGPLVQTKIIAHRGSKGTAPENTLESFRAALKSNCDGIELDVHLSQDLVPVVIHDETVNRTSNGEGYVYQKTYQELQQLDAGSWFNKRFTGARIPSLEEVLQLLKVSSFKGMLNIELKTDKIAYPLLEETVVDLVERYQPDYQVVYSSFNVQSLQKVIGLVPNAEIAILFKKRGAQKAFLPNGHPIQAWHGSHRLVNDMIKNNKRKIPIRLWTVNRLFDLGYCLNKNVDAIITDYPNRALRVRDRVQGE